ncbi:MAG: hypothetical protein MJ231_02435 [bacterium]|nr:hypothetical protein [bacterium]
MKTKNRSVINKLNGQKGGRPKPNPQIKFEIPDIKLVILTPTQYNSLLEKYGYKLLRKSLEILDEWLSNGSRISDKYVGKNNYAHFRSDGWVINTAKCYIDKFTNK